MYIHGQYKKKSECESHNNHVDLWLKIKRENIIYTIELEQMNHIG